MHQFTRYFKIMVEILEDESGHSSTPRGMVERAMRKLDGW